MCDDQAKTVRACLGSSDSSTIFTKHGTFEFPFISVFTKFSYWKEIFPLKTVKRHLEQQFFAQNDRKFWEHGIMKLPGKWQRVVGQNGEHVVQSSSWAALKIHLLVKKIKGTFWPTHESSRPFGNSVPLSATRPCNHCDWDARRYEKIQKFRN